MKRISRLFSKRTLRNFSIQSKEIKKIADRLQSYQKDKNHVSNHLYYSIEKIYKYDVLVEEKVKHLKNFPENMKDISSSLNADLVREYFKIRLEVGFNESLLAGLLRTLAGQTHRNHDYRELKADIAGPFLLQSPIFKLVVDDIRLLTFEKMEIDLSKLASIVRSLTKLDYKDPALMKKLLDKMMYLIRNPKSAINELGDNSKEQLLQPSLQNYSQILDKSVFKGFLDDIMQIKNEPINANRALKELKRIENEDVEDLDQLLTRLDSVISNYKTINIEFLNTIMSIRSYYFDLKEEEKLALLKSHPDIYLDFLRLENNLIKCGFLMPRDLLESSSKEDQESVSLLLENLILEVGADPKFISDLLQLNDKSTRLSDSNENFSESSILRDTQNSSGGIQLASKNEQIIQDEANRFTSDDSYFYARVLEVLESILDNMRSRTSCIDPKDNYRFEGFRYAFNDSGNSIRDVMKDKLGKIPFDPSASFQVIDEEKTNIGHFYFTKAFDICHEISQQLLQDLKTKIRESPFNSETDLLDLEGSIRLFLVGQKVLNIDLIKFAEEKVISQLESGAPISIEALQTVARATEHLSHPILAKIINIAGEKNLFNPNVVEKLFKSDDPLSEHINVAFFYYSVLSLSESKDNLAALKKLIFNFASNENLKSIYYFHYKKEIPVTYEYHKLYYVLQFIKEHEKEFSEHSDMKSMTDFEKARIKVNSYLNIDFQYLIQGDPVFAMIFNKMIETNPETAQNLQDLHLLLDIPLPILPPIVFKTPAATHCLVLNLPNENENSVSSAVRRAFLKSRISNSEIQIINIVKFFADNEFYRSMNFDFSQNLDEILKGIWEIKHSNQGAEMKAVEAIFSISSHNLKDSKKLKDQKSHFIKIFSNIERSVSNSQSFDDTKMSIIRKALVFYIKAFLEVLSREILESQKVELQNLANEIGGKIPANQLAFCEFPFSFHGKRFSLEKIIKSDAANVDCRNFINYKTFSDPSYIFIESWRNEIEEYLDPMQFSESVDSFYTKNGRFKKLLLPCVTGRQISRPSFQFFWEELAYSTNKDQKQKVITYETIASLNNYSRLNMRNRWRVSLLNFVYELKTQANLQETLTRIFELDFWKILLKNRNESANAKGIQKNDIENVDPLLTYSDVEYFINRSIKAKIVASPYEDFMKSKIEIKKSLEYWKDLFEVTLPKLYSLAESDLARQNIHDTYVNAKEKYMEALTAYENDFAVVDSAFNVDYFKDLIMSINSKENEENKDSLTSLNQKTSVNQDIAAISLENCLKHLIIFKENYGKELNVEEKIFKQKWSETIAHDGISDTSAKNITSNWTIGEILSENDCKFFEENFLHSKIENFKQEKFTDFLTMFNLLLNPDSIAVKEASLFVESRLSHSDDSRIEFNANQLTDFIVSPISNVTRFDLEYSLNNIWFKSSRINDSERKILKEMLSVYKSKLKRGIKS
jgi:hypothetical protein